MTKTKTKEELATLRKEKTQALSRYTRAIKMWVTGPNMEAMLSETRGEKVTESWFETIKKAEGHLTDAYEAVLENLGAYMDALDPNDPDTAAEMSKAEDSVATS